MKLPSVTKILSPWQDFSKVPPEVLANAADRGVRVHQACSTLIQGLWFSEPPEDIYGYVESFANWVDTADPICVAAEVELVDISLGFCGHPDLICLIGPDVIVIDLKTPASPAASWRLQLAAYHHLANINGYAVNRTATLRLSKDGKPAKFDEFTATTNTDFAVFLNCLSAYRYFKGDSRD